MGDKEDPDRVIFEFSTHIAVPKWQPKTAYKECFHCRDAFSGGHQHNCRLCGELFCSECTGKYCLPSMFAGPKKHKADEAVRVCYGCKMSCNQEKKRREEEKKGVNVNSIPKSKRNVVDEKVMYPPVWKDLVGYTACVKCNKKGGKPHNCRGCGDLFCEKCTSKIMVPAAFEKKDKKGPARVCDECRYKIKGGWRLLESKQVDEKKVIVDDDIPLPDDAPPEDGIAITVKKENEVAALGKVTVRETATLVEIDVKFKKNAPAGLRFDYLCRGQIVHKVFWDIFTARIIGNVLYVRPEPSHEEVRRRQQAEASVAAGMGAMAMGMMPTPMAVEAVSAVNNPFKAKEEKKKAAEPPKPMVVFKKPGKVKKTQSVDFTQLSRVATSGPPPSGLGSGQPTGPAFIEKTPEEKKAAAPVAAAVALVGDPFKARAALFKAMS